MQEDLKDIVGLRFANEVQKVDIEVAKDKVATDRQMSAKGVYLSGARFRKDIDRHSGRAEKLARFLMDAWVDVIRKRNNVITKEDAQFIYGEVCHFLAGIPPMEVKPAQEGATQKAIERELTKHAVDLESSIKRTLEAMHLEDAIPKPVPPGARHNQDKSLVFISCGQFASKERQLGMKIEALAKEYGLEGYFAQNQSSVGALTANVFKKLRDASALVVVMHPRGEVKGLKGETHARASVWIEQEVAIAAYLQHVEEHQIRVAAFVHRELEYVRRCARKTSAQPDCV